VKDDDRPFLAYSPMITMKDSSVPFRALLGAILSVVKSVPVEPSEFNADIQLDTIVEEGPLREDGIDDGSAYLGSEEEKVNGPPNTPNHDGTGQENGLMVCPCLLSLVIYLAHLPLGHLVFPRLA
jgi:hypothetical protein